MKKTVKQQISGFSEIEQEIRILRKQAPDRSVEKGQVSRIIDRLHPRKLNLTVSEIREETATAKTIRLVSRNHYLPPFQAGQYINLFLDVNGIRTSRPYSISSSPGQTAYYDITVRRVKNGFFSNYLLDEVKTGDQFQSTSPAGYFHHNPLFHGRDLVFIAGGSGITPFMSMIREVTDKGMDRRIHLIYGSQQEDDIIFSQELSERASRHENLSVTHVITSPSSAYAGHTGFITREVIQAVLGNQDLTETMFYLCGPEAMYGFVLAHLEKLDVPKRRIRIEIFGPPADITAHPGWPEQITKTDRFQVRLKNGKVFEAAAGEPLMNSLERNGIALETSCRSGVCSLCRTKLLSGKVFHPAGVQIRKSDRKYGYIHPCMAYPLEDLELLI
jgi:ferredoxin-NADP reductase